MTSHLSAEEICKTCRDLDIKQLKKERPNRNPIVVTVKGPLEDFARYEECITCKLLYDGVGHCLRSRSSLGSTIPSQTAPCSLDDGIMVEFSYRPQSPPELAGLRIWKTIEGRTRLTDLPDSFQFDIYVHPSESHLVYLFVLS